MSLRFRLLYILGWGICALMVIGLRADALLQPLPEAFPEDRLRVAIDPSYPPFASFTESEVVGLDVDLAYALGEQLGLPVDLNLLGVDALYDALRDRRVDVIISTIQPEAWRTGDALYTQPYFDAGLVLVGNSGLTAMIDLPGHSLAYAFGSAADAEARIWSRRVAAFETQPYELPIYALDAARLDHANAALIDAITARQYLQDHPDWQADLHQVTHVPFVIAVRVDETGTFNAVTDALDDLFSNGMVEAIIIRWLG